MVGFAFGAACLFGLWKVVKGGHGHCGGHWHEHRSGGPWRHPSWRGESWSGREGGRREGFWLRRLFEKLDTTPGQEKVIRSAAGDLLGAAGSMREEWDASRRDIANAVRSGLIDEVQLGELFARQDEKLREMRKAAIDALARVSEALDDGQRALLADLLERRWGSGFGGWERRGPYRESRTREEHTRDRDGEV